MKIIAWLQTDDTWIGVATAGKDVYFFDGYTVIDFTDKRTPPEVYPVGSKVEPGEWYLCLPRREVKKLKF